MLGGCALPFQHCDPWVSGSAVGFIRVDRTLIYCVALHGWSHCRLGMLTFFEAAEFYRPCKGKGKELNRSTWTHQLRLLLVMVDKFRYRLFPVGS